MGPQSRQYAVMFRPRRPTHLPFVMRSASFVHGRASSGGVPELRDLPHRQLARAYRSALSGRSARRLLDYEHPQGNVELRTALAEMLASLRGVAAPPEAITVVRGSQHGLYLAARALVRPGDVVAVEQLGYRPAWNALELAGATLVPVPVD